MWPLEELQIFAILHWLYFPNPEVATRLTQLASGKWTNANLFCLSTQSTSYNLPDSPIHTSNLGLVSCPSMFGT